MLAKRRYLVYASLFLLNTVNYADRTNLSVAAGSIASTFDLSPVQLGYMFSSFLWTYLFCLIPAGLAVDKFGARAITALALVVWSVGGILTGLASTFFLLLGSRLILGIGEAASFPAGGRIVREWAPRSERGLAASVLNAGSYAGPALGGVFVGWLITHLGWRGSFVVTGLIGVIMGFAWAVLYRTPLKAVWLSEDERRLIREGESAAAPAGAKGTPRRGAMRTLLASRTMWGLALTQGCAGYTLYLFLTWLPTYFERARGMSIMNSSLLTSAPYATACILGIALGWLSDRLLTPEALSRGARRNMICAVLLLSSVVLITPLMESNWAIVAIISIALTCVSTAMSMNIALTNDLLREQSYAGVATSFLILGGNLFGLAAPIVTGYAVAASGGFAAAFTIAGVLLLAGALASIALTRATIDGPRAGADARPDGVAVALD
jgi:ACS family glucarate transporter-like MFS transporter